MLLVPRVLVIDDEPSVRQTIQVLLKRYCAVTTVGSGQEGVEAVRESDYDIAIIDIRMPGMSGIETLKQLKQVRPDTEVLMITGGDYYQEPVKEAIKLGAADCIYKPVERDELKIRIMETMRYRRSAQLRRA